MLSLGLFVILASLVAVRVAHFIDVKGRIVRIFFGCQVMFTPTIPHRVLFPPDGETYERDRCVVIASLHASSGGSHALVAWPQLGECQIHDVQILRIGVPCTEESYHIVSSYHIISYHIISYHIISYHIILHHIVPLYCTWQIYVYKSEVGHYVSEYVFVENVLAHNS